MMSTRTHRRTQMYRQRGFTLVELIVSVFIFAIVMTISMGTLIVLIDANEKGQGLQMVMTNLTFAFDSMTRNMRTGGSYYCEHDWEEWDNGDDLPLEGETQDCEYDPENPGRVIVYTDGRTGDRTAFRLNEPGGRIERKVEDGDWIRVTAPELFVTDFNVAVDGTYDSDTQGTYDLTQPTADIFVEGYIVSDDDTDTDFRLQASITQRIIDY